MVIFPKSSLVVSKKIVKHKAKHLCQLSLLFITKPLFFKLSVHNSYIVTPFWFLLSLLVAVNCDCLIPDLLVHKYDCPPATFLGWTEKGLHYSLEVYIGWENAKACVACIPLASGYGTCRTVFVVKCSPTFTTYFNGLEI